MHAMIFLLLTTLLAETTSTPHGLLKHTTPIRPPVLQRAALEANSPQPQTTENLASGEYYVYIGFLVLGVIMAVLFLIGASAPMWFPTLMKRWKMEGKGKKDREEQQWERSGEAETENVKMEDMTRLEPAILPPEPE